MRRLRRQAWRWTLSRWRWRHSRRRLRLLYELFVIAPALQDLIDVCDRLGAAREAVFHDRIVVDAALRFADQPVADVEPRMRIVAVFRGEAHGVLHVAGADVVRGENEFDALAVGLDFLPLLVDGPEIAAGRFHA